MDTGESEELVGRRCSGYKCENMTDGRHKRCLSCRQKSTLEARRYQRRMRETDAQKAEKAREKRQWSQERWEAFINAGGLEGL